MEVVIDNETEKVKRGKETFVVGSQLHSTGWLDDEWEFRGLTSPNFILICEKDYKTDKERLYTEYIEVGHVLEFSGYVHMYGKHYHCKMTISEIDVKENCFTAMVEVIEKRG